MPSKTQYERSESQCTLPPLLHEFRLALQKEIEAAQRNEANSAIPLANGHRIGQSGGYYHYRFEIENALSLPGDAPGDLILAKRPPIQVEITSVEGLSITIAAHEDLGPFVGSAQLRTNLTLLLRKLIQRIEAISDRANPVGARIQGDAPVSGEPIEFDAEGQGLNPEQIQAVASCLGRDTTFVWGPPGTGKSYTIGAIASELFKRQRTALLVSHTNTAVDEALKYVAKGLKEFEAELAHGAVIRVGEPKDPQLKESLSELLLETHVARRSANLLERREKLDVELSSRLTELDAVVRQIEIIEWVEVAESDIAEFDRALSNLKVGESDLTRHLDRRTDLRNQEKQLAPACASAADAQDWRTKLKDLQGRIDELKRQRIVSLEKKRASETLLHEAEALLAETQSVGRLARAWRRLPNPEQQEIVVLTLKQNFDADTSAFEAINQAGSDAVAQATSLRTRFQEFRERYNSEPEAILDRAKKLSLEIKEAEAKLAVLTRSVLDERDALESMLKERLNALKAAGLTTESGDSAEDSFNAIRRAFQRALSGMRSMDIAALRLRRGNLQETCKKITDELREIEQALQHVEEIVIRDATIVATTLTRAYLRDSIQNRLFDTVILDEASMAPIPALWVAASIARQNGVVVGDYEQLPPIVQSRHEISQKWLGRDIFDVANVSHKTRPDHFVALKRQHRMQPAISRIPNQLIYDGFLIDEVDENRDGMEDWYRFDWGFDEKVLLVDTGPLHAWVTSVARGQSSSRLNFLSATVCVDVAEQLVRPDRLPASDKPRALLVCPYRPHASLLRILLKEQHLDADVRAGTAHSFQGSEADVVILDLVNDEPHWRVNMFNPQQDKATKKLLNVSMTRAKKRLIIVGDFNYYLKQARNAFLGRDLVPFLIQSYRVVSALDIVPNGIAARAARAQAVIFGGEIEPDTDRIVVTQEHFFTVLRGDIERAMDRLVIYSPFITENRLGYLGIQLRSAIERGVRVFIVTKAHSERLRDKSSYVQLEQTLKRWGATVIHKKGMHEKLVFVDRDILWSGSLNPLSFADTQEIMERRKSETVVREYEKTLRLNELLQEFFDGEPTCPYCSGEVVASEGAREPYYWLCVNGCYKRGIDDPPVRDEMVTCSTCGGPVQLGEWGGKFAWRCTGNKQHRRPVAASHVRLPKIRAMLSKKQIAALEDHFGTKSIESSDAQIDLFSPPNETNP